MDREELLHLIRWLVKRHSVHSKAENAWVLFVPSLKEIIKKRGAHATPGADNHRRNVEAGCYKGPLDNADRPRKRCGDHSHEIKRREATHEEYSHRKRCGPTLPSAG